MGVPLASLNSEKQPLLPTTEKETCGKEPTTNEVESPILDDSRDNIRGYIYMGLSTIGFAGMATFVRATESKYAFPPLSAVFVRGLVQMILGATFISTTIGFRSGLAPIDSRTGMLLLLRSFAGTCGLMCMYHGLKFLPLGEAQTIFFSNPVLVMILSYFFLNEPIAKVDILAALTSIAGIVLVAHPYDAHDVIPAKTRIIGSLFSFGAAVCSSVAYVSIRTLSTRVHFLVNVFAFGVVSCCQAALFGGAIGLDFVRENKTSSLLILISALFAFMGQSFLTKGLQHCRAGPGILIRNLDVPVLYLLGLVFLGEVPSFVRLLGSSLVLMSVLALGINRLLKS